MKKLFITVLPALLLTGMLAACQGYSNEPVTEAPHKHTFASEWSMDEDGHWYDATCGHEMQANLATHTDSDNDGTCEICGWDGGHEHTFAEQWSHDAANHWYAATCLHAVKKDEAPHADTDNNGICDDCDWNYDHTHTYASEWSHDNGNHWHDVTCGHDVEVKGKETHEDTDNNGICDGCGWDYDHTHEYAEAWTHDADNHWKDTVCGHAVVSEQAAHADENNDGICDGCAWNYDHEHTYDSGNSWTINDTHHWHAPTCGHDVEGIDQVAHTDADDNEECDVCGYDYTHQHDYDMTVWSWDKNSHYHAATCGHAVRADEEAHKDANNDGICDVCEWNYDHTHEFSAEWTYDTNDHWHTTTCAHSVKDGVEPHKDTNNDGVCDVCAWDYDHTHTFDTSKPAIGANTHYFAPTCGHDAKYVRDAEENHTDKDRDDKCDICGGFVSLEIVVDYATSDDATAHVQSGVIDLSFSSSGYIGKVNYEFGDGYLHITDHQQYSGIQNQYEYWYATYGDGALFAIQQEGGDPFRNMGAESIFMNGYYFSGEFVSYAFNCYGVEDLVYQLYGMPISTDFSAACADFMEHYDQTTDTYSFSYLYNELYVSVSFKINKDFVLTDVEIRTGTTADVLDSTVIIKQTAGKQIAINPYDPDVVLISSYKIVDSLGQEIKSGDEINMITGADYKLDLQVTDIFPSTADPALDRVRISCNDETAVLTYAGASGNMIINARKEGTYTITFTTDKQSKSITIHVVFPAPTSIGTQVYSPDGSYETVAEYTMYLGDVIHFNAAVPTDTDKRYTAAITGNAANATLMDTTIEVLLEEIAVTSFTPSALGDYEITITSAADPSVTGKLVIHVVETVNICDILNGTWVYSTTWKVVFTPESVGATKGTVEITNTPKSGTAKTAVYAYEYLTNGLQITYVSGDQFNVKLSVNSDFQMKIGAYTMKRPE